MFYKDAEEPEGTNTIVGLDFTVQRGDVPFRPALRVEIAPQWQSRIVPDGNPLLWFWPIPSRSGIWLLRGQPES